MSGSMGYVDQVEVTIAAGQSLSDIVLTQGRTPLWLDTPADLSGTTISFVAVDAAVAERVLVDRTGAEITLTIGTAGRRHSLMTEIAAQLAGHQAIKLRVGTVGAPTNQAAARTLRLGMRNVV